MFISLQLMLEMPTICFRASSESPYKNELQFRKLFVWLHCPK